jgi:hypothetical protein
MLPNRVPMGSYTPSPEPLVYLFMYVCLSPQKGALLQNGEKHRVTVHRAPHKQKAYILWGAAWFPKRTVNNTATLPQCHADLSMIPSTLAWVEQSPISQCAS